MSGGRTPVCASCGGPVRLGARFCPGCGATLPLACPGCGQPVDPTARFCEACGSPLAAGGAAPTATTSLPVSEPPSAPAPPAAAPLPPGVTLPVSFGAGRYQVRRFLGEGGRKRVYQAYDRALDREVALATVKTEDLDTAALERVRREAQAMGRLGDHPHIVTVFDIGDEDGRPYIVSQFMPGGSVEELLAGAEGHRLAVPDAVRIADEIVSALEHAHARGIVHRDIKPANVWLTEGGSTRLGDFGLAAAATSTSRSRLTKEGMMVGTVAYMAPEQALGQEVDTRADLYSLGALLYELLAGRPPFMGPDAVAVISQTINTPPMAPWWHNPDVPRDLGALVLELLAKTPEERPAAATDVRQRLAESMKLPTGADAGSAPETVTPAGGRRTARLNRLSRFVGRAEELRDLKRAVEASLQGRGGLVMISGEPGIGKTRLAEEAGIYARLGGAQVLAGRCYEAESTVPYMPFVEALRAYVATRPVDVLREELGEAASEVAKLVSEVRNILPDVPESSRPSGDEERYRLFESVSSFLVNASRSAPIMLLLDDLHWADAPSLRLLQHLSRRLADSRILVVGTYRDVELSRRHPLAQALVELRRDQTYQRILLRGLSMSEVREFLEGLTERELEPSEEPLVPAFFRETEGNPYFVEEVVRHLLETGGAFWEGGRWTMDLASVESLAIPEGIRELIGRRLSQLSSACNDVLTRAAVLGAQFDFAVLERMTGLEEDTLLAALEEALQTQLIEQAGAQHGQALYRFGHAVIRQTLYEDLSLPRRQRLHLRAAEAIEAVYARNLVPHLPALANHFRQAGAAADPARAVDYSVQAGEAAQAVFAYEDAARHWEAALELLEDQGGDTATQAALLARLGDLHFVSGLDLSASIACLEKALRLYQQLERPDRVAQMHSRLGRDLSSYPVMLDIPRALSHYRAAEAIVADQPESSALGYVYFGQADTALWAVRTEEGLAAAERALAVAARVGNDRLRRHASTQHAYLLVAAGRAGEASALLESTWQEADAARDATAAFTATWIAAGTAFDLGDPDTARAWCRRELATARLTQAPHPRRTLLDELGRAEAAAGDLAAARKTRDEAGESRYAAPVIAFYEGRFDEARALWENLREQERRAGNRRDEWTSTFRLGLLRQLEGDAAGAEALLSAALAITTEGSQRNGELSTRIELAILLADSARPDDARGHLARAAELASEADDVRGQGARLALAEAAVLGAEGRLEDAMDRCSAAAEGFRRFALPFDEAASLRRAGLLLLAKGDGLGAVQKLAGTLELYRRHGAGTRWIEPVLTEKLAAQGIDPSEKLDSVGLVAAAVVDERPDLRAHTSPEGTVTLLFSDIEASTAVNERLGDRRWMEVLRTHNRNVRQQLSRHGGFEVKSQGDGFMVAFSSARRALACAIDIQLALAEHASRHPEEAVAVRIGLHTGEAVKEGDDFFGTHVALAARVAAAARGGEILVSSLLKELTEGSGEFTFGPGRTVALKGLTGTRQVYDLHWRAGPPDLAEVPAPEPAVAVTETAPEPETAPVGPRRLRTVLIADVDPAVHDERLRGVIGDQGELIAVDAGVMVSFASAADAVSCAIRLQRDHRDEAAAPPRIGLHAGSAPGSGAAGGQDSVAGTARSLCRRAVPGMILCSEVVSGLLAGRPRFAFASLGAVEAEGGPGSVTTYEVRFDLEEVAFSMPVALAGRQTETARLVERLQEAGAGRGGLVMLAGEQGIGKTRLADEVATRAERDGFTVLWGRCYEGEWPPPYGPFAEALEAHSAVADLGELAEDLGPAAGVVAQVVPGLRRVVADAASAPVPPEEERHRLLDGVARFLVALSRRAPVLLLLDDLHWADRSTVAMLRHLSRLTAPERLLVIGTYRDVDLDRSHPLTDALAAWPREAGYDHLRLEGLDVEGVTAFLSGLGGQEFEPRIGAAWARETGGNPFFVLELVRHLVEEGKIYRGLDGLWTTTAKLRDMALPVAARDVVNRRLARLSEATGRLLGVAAAFQGAFRFDVAAGVAGLSEEEGLDCLDEAVAARILEPSGDTETYAFTHAVIRHALYDGLVPSRRSRLHRRVAEALAAGDGPGRASAAEIAVQYHRSVALPGAEAGVDPALEAADLAQGTGAYDEAATFLRMALDLLPPGDRRRPRLLGRLGIVLAWALAYEEAVGVARRAGDAIAESETKQAAAEYLSDAAYVCASAGGIVASWELARAGLTYAGARDVAWARLVCFDYQRREAEAKDHPGIPFDTVERREAAAILHAAALDPLGPAPMEAVFDAREEAAKSSNLIVLLLWAAEYQRCLPLFEAEARDAEGVGRLARAARAWACVAFCHAALGRVPDARQALARAQSLATRVGVPVATVLYPQYLLCATLDEGWEQLAAVFTTLSSSLNPALAWTLGFLYSGQAVASARLGLVDEALATLDNLVPWLEEAPTWTVGFASLANGAAEVLWLLGRTDHLAVLELALREKVLPADLRFAMADGRLALARLCAVDGRHDEALGWFAEARRALDEEGARPLRAVCDLDEATMRLRRGAPGDAAAAGTLRTAAMAQFEALGMTGWLRRAEAL